MHSFLLCIGSNYNTLKNIIAVKERLLRYFPEIYFTQTSESEPYGKNYTNQFMNMLATFQSVHPLETTNTILKNIEHEMGRTSEDKKHGKVVIDLDIIAFDAKIVRPTDYKRSYVQDLLKHIPHEYLTLEQ